MGSPLSGILADIFLDSFETEIFSHQCMKNCLFYARYMDDSFCLIKGNIDMVETVQNAMNSIHPSIKFTYELEENKKILFLDVQIEKQRNTFKFGTYRKPFHSKYIIPKWSHHAYAQKMSYFRHGCRRLFYYCDNSKDMEAERNYLIKIALMNGYKKSDVLDIYNKEEIKFRRSHLSALSNLHNETEDFHQKSRLKIMKNTILDNQSRKFLRRE